jgi:hypothetical protein
MEDAIPLGLDDAAWEVVGNGEFLEEISRKFLRVVRS